MRPEGLQRAIAANDLYDLIVHAHLTGSNYTVDPPVTNTDIDFLVFIREDDQGHFLCGLSEEGWDECSSKTAEGRELYKLDPNYSSTWYSMRKDKFNIIVSWDWQWYCRAIAATELCRVLNIKDKQGRCDTFRHVRDLSQDHEVPEVE